MSGRHAGAKPRAASRAGKPPKTTGRGRMEDWLASHQSAVLWIFVALAVSIRAAGFIQLNATPLAQLSQWRESDMHYYDAWGRQIAGGDWLSSGVRLPMHSWHRSVAAQYFSAHSDDRERLSQAAAAAAGDVSPEELLWNRWMRVPAFYQDPLYAYLIALTYRVAGPDPRYVIVWQLALGIVGTLLIWRLTVRWFGHAVGLCAGVLALLNGPLVFYELLLLRDSVIVFAGLGSVWLIDRAFRRGGAGHFAVLGVVLGASLLLKGTFILLAAGVLIAVLVRFRHQPSTLARACAALLAGLVIALAPLVARNLAVGVAPLSLASSGPLTFVASNERNYLADVGFGIDAPVLADVLGRTNSRWRPAVAATLEGHSVRTYLDLLWMKWDRAWHWYEIPNNENFYYMRTQVPVLAWLPVTFWLCAPLGLVGLGLGLRRIGDAWPLYLLVAASLLPLILFYVLARFRIELAAALLPLAALAVVETMRALAAGRFARAGVLAASVVLLGEWTGRPPSSRQLLIRMADWILPYSAYYQPRVTAAIEAGDWRQAGAWYLEFFRFEPDAGRIVASGDPALAPELADMHMECARILNMAGEPALAQTQADRAQRLLALAAVQ